MSHAAAGRGSVVSNSIKHSGRIASFLITSLPFLGVPGHPSARSDPVLASLDDPAVRLRSFERHYEAIAKPFQWKFTDDDLQRLLQRMKTPGQLCYRLAA